MWHIFCERKAIRDDLTAHDLGADKELVWLQDRQMGTLWGCSGSVWWDEEKTNWVNHGDENLRQCWFLFSTSTENWGVQIK